MNLKSIFKGKKLKRVYWYGEDYGSFTPFGFRIHTQRIQSKLETIETPVFLELDIKEPALHNGDKFYNHENNDIYLIEDAMRGTEDTMVYFTDVVLETIVDEESKLKAENEKVVHENLQKENRDKYDAQQKAKAEEEEYILKNKSWWKKLLNYFRKE